MAAVEAGFEKSLSQTLSGINLENVFVRVKQIEAIRNIVILKKETIYFCFLPTVIDFPVIALFL